MNFSVKHVSVTFYSMKEIYIDIVYLNVKQAIIKNRMNVYLVIQTAQNVLIKIYVLNVLKDFVYTNNNVLVNALLIMFVINKYVKSFVMIKSNIFREIYA